MSDDAILLARQILQQLPKSDVNELIRVLRYFNNFDGDDRANAMTLGSTTTNADHVEIERYVQKSLRESLQGRYSARAYISSSKDVCKLCGK